MKTVLVTGASGFIGRALCGRLARDGYRVKGT
ncbi:MAG: NAD-dependent epimerase/dehydratase family protein, partial [Syntrophaceae bacterium]